MFIPANVRRIMWVWGFGYIKINSWWWWFSSWVQKGRCCRRRHNKLMKLRVPCGKQRIKTWWKNYLYLFNVLTWQRSVSSFTQISCFCAIIFAFWFSTQVLYAQLKKMCIKNRWTKARLITTLVNIFTQNFSSAGCLPSLSQRHLVKRCLQFLSVTPVSTLKCLSR